MALFFQEQVLEKAQKERLERLNIYEKEKREEEEKQAQERELKSNNRMKIVNLAMGITGGSVCVLLLLHWVLKWRGKDALSSFNFNSMLRNSIK